MEVVNLFAIVLVEIVHSTVLLLVISAMDLLQVNVCHVFLENCQEVVVYQTVQLDSM